MSLEDIPKGEDFWCCDVCANREICSQSIVIDGGTIPINICDCFMEEE